MKKLLIVLGVFAIGFVIFASRSPFDEEIKASRLISDCWNEEIKMCKNENKGDACTFGAYQ